MTTLLATTPLARAMVALVEANAGAKAIKDKRPCAWSDREPTPADLTHAAINEALAAYIHETRGLPRDA